MRYHRILLIGILLVLCTVAVFITILHLCEGSCPEGTFACGESNLCVPQRNVCNQLQDCPNGADEDPVLCYDVHGSINLLSKIVNRSKIINEINFSNTYMNTCGLKEYPQNCTCKQFSKLFCKNIGLTEVPSNISNKVTHLILANNSITLLSNSFSRYKLKMIHLEGNDISFLPVKVFSKQKKLEKLLLMHNNLTKIDRTIFSNLTNLVWLFLNDNHFKNISLQSFKDLVSLEWINLSNNELSLHDEVFPRLPGLIELSLSHNNVQQITKKMFSSLENLELLNLRNNRISFIHEKSFNKLKQLRELDISQNNLFNISPKLFRWLRLLSKLYLGNNPLHHVPSSLFASLQSLRSLNMEAIEITNIDLKMFIFLKNLKSVYFKKYSYCAYAPIVPRCRPVSDGISSTEHLLFKPTLRYTTWIICLLTCSVNGLVLWGRHVFKDENNALNLVIRNLAVSDFLMGIYLLMIAAHDLKYRQIYNREAHKWMSSWSCTFAGILAMTSSEVSVFLLVFVSMERFLLITYPFGRHSVLTMHTARIVLAIIWAVGIALAIFPVIHWHNASTKYYGTNGMCVPFHIHEPYLLGWQYTTFMFLGINSIGLLTMIIAYCSMFVSIYRTRKATSLPFEDYDFAVRFFFIVLTDIGCWLPIIVAKGISFLHVEISADIHAWIVVFVLPINSALNPILYTFTSPRYRIRLFGYA